jgi:hypothetical protein
VTAKFAPVTAACIYMLQLYRIRIVTFGRQKTLYDDEDDGHNHYKIEDKVKTTLPKVGDNKET